MKDNWIDLMIWFIKIFNISIKQICFCNEYVSILMSMYNEYLYNKLITVPIIMYKTYVI